MNGEYNLSLSPRVGIFWDFENYPPPSKLNGCDMGNRIRRLGQHFGTVVAFKAYLDQSVTSCTKAMRSQLQSSGVSLTDCPRPDRDRKDVADKMILADLMAFAYDNPLPSAIILISGDKDFAYAISVLRSQLYSVILVHRGSDVSPNLVAQPNIAIDGNRIFEPGWEDMLAGLPEIFDRRTTLRHLREIEDGGVHVEEGEPPVQQEEVVPTPATAAGAMPDETREETSRSPVPSVKVGLESEPNKETGAVVSDSLKDHHEPLSDSSNQADPVDAAISRDIHSSTESVHSTSSAKDGPPPPPIPPRPLGYPSAKTAQFMPLVDYPESVSDSSDDEHPEPNPVETCQDTSSLPHLNVESFPPDLQSAPDLTSPSSSTVPASSLKEIPEVFLDLIDVLDQARCMGIDYLNPETLEQMVLHRNPDLLIEARVERFGTYLKLADNQGVVEYNGMSQGVKLKEIL
ncbi:hypothetical protein M407DRAFT_8598 [Tulasnella calospora MUT 4182]|uniref:NYN domain-containing protein n=1 Tax=Tulasnella calospora MUT 4182 TaxID=1051891 RepID=A0A0C3LUG9_9AGAM|nr:hypothetical protein M407DRAFT_8598 [Tulasnella calospora MUT 4182]